MPMTEETPETTGEIGGEGWTTTEIAAKALRVTPRTIRNYVKQDTLEGRRVQRGRARPLEIDIASLKRLRDSMGIPADTDLAQGGYREPPSREDAMATLALELANAAARAARAETRAELTERAESSLKAEIKRLRSELDEERNKPWWRRVFR